jgi:hypothetical protein
LGRGQLAPVVFPSQVRHRQLVRRRVRSHQRRHSRIPRARRHRLRVGEPGGEILPYPELLLLLQVGGGG